MAVYPAPKARREVDLEPMLEVGIADKKVVLEKTSTERKNLPPRAYPRRSLDQAFEGEHIETGADPNGDRIRIG